MATGPIKAQFVYEERSLYDHAITRQSSAGAYYSLSEVDITKSGYTPVSCHITGWSNVKANVSTYIYQGKVGFLSDTSQTPSLLSVGILYRAN